MPEINPSYLQAGTHSALSDRQALTTLLAQSGGTRDAGSFAVTPGGGMDLSVAAGAGWTQEVAGQGVYHFSSDSAVTLTLTGSDSVNGRIDLVVAQVHDSTYTGDTDTWTVEVVEGVAAPTPVAPALPDRAMLLATVDVAAGVAAVGAGEITDERVQGALNTDLIANVGRQISLGGFKVVDLGTPTNATDAANKAYVDSAVLSDGWVVPTLANSWVNYGSVYSTAGYRRDANGVVHLRGLLRYGTIGNPMFTLPAGYRPTSSGLFAVVVNVGGGALQAGRLDISSNGQVVPHISNPSNGFFSLDGVVFHTT